MRVLHRKGVIFNYSGLATGSDSKWLGVSKGQLPPNPLLTRYDNVGLIAKLINTPYNEYTSNIVMFQNYVSKMLYFVVCVIIG